MLFLTRLAMVYRRSTFDGGRVLIYYLRRSFNIYSTCVYFLVRKIVFPLPNDSQIDKLVTLKMITVWTIRIVVR